MSQILLFTCEEYTKDLSKFSGRTKTSVPDTFYDKLTVKFNDPSMDFGEGGNENRVIVYKDSKGVVHEDSYNTNKKKFRESYAKYLAHLDDLGEDESDTEEEVNDFQDAEIYYQFSLNKETTSRGLLWLIVKALNACHVTHVCINDVHYNPETSHIIVGYST